MNTPRQPGIRRTRLAVAVTLSLLPAATATPKAEPLWVGPEVAGPLVARTARPAPAPVADRPSRCARLAVRGFVILSQKGVQAMIALSDNVGARLGAMLNAPGPDPPEAATARLLPPPPPLRPPTDPPPPRSPADVPDTATPIAVPSAVTLGTAPVSELFMRSTSVAFLVTVLLVPFGCHLTAGAIYGRPRDGPRGSGEG